MTVMIAVAFLLGSATPGTQPLGQSETPVLAAPQVSTSFEGPSLELDFPSLFIGVAEYEKGPTGATVFYFPNKVMAAVDVRGGAPGTLNSDALRLGYERREMDAVVLAGGSWYGLAAATGVADEIKTFRTNAGEWDGVAGVVAGIIFDLGDRRFTLITPDYELGRAAVRAARPGRFPLGARGAGRFAMQGRYFARDGEYADWAHSGQGGAFRQIGPTKIAVFTVVNALGTVVDRAGNVARCRMQATSCGPIADWLRRKAVDIAQSAPSEREAGDQSADDNSQGPTQNTTITLVVTNQKLPFWALQRLAVQVHTSMARAIQPFSTENDGDVLYAVTTAEVENTALAPVDLGVIASEVAWDAILSSLPERDPPQSTEHVQVAERELEVFAGLYGFAPGARLVVRRDGARLKVEPVGKGGVYFPAGEETELAPVGATDFLLQTSRADRIRFEREGDRVVGLTLNPGQWSQYARRQHE